METLKIQHLLFAFLLIFITAACKKEIAENMQNENRIAPAFKTFNYSDAELDTAMVFIEEVVNHDEGNASHVFTDMIIDSMAYSLTVNVITVNGVPGLSASEQQRIKDSVLRKTRAYPLRIDTSRLNDHDLIFTDISGWTLSGNTLSFWGNSGIGDLNEDYLNDPDCNLPLPYQESDNWRWGDLAGNCDPLITKISDASLEMERRLNFMKSFHCRTSPCEYPNQEYFKNIVTTKEYPYDHPNPNDPNPGDGWYDYLLWENGGDGRTCVTRPEMVFYTAGAKTIANKPGVHPGGNYRPIHYDIINDLIPGGPGSPYLHSLRVYYGILSCK